jgi:hypothetical protein
MEIRKSKERVNAGDTEKERPSQNALKASRVRREEGGNPKRGTSIHLTKAEPRPVEDEVDCPAAAFDC